VNYIYCVFVIYLCIIISFTVFTIIIHFLCRGESLHLPPDKILTAYGSPWNTFLGYYIQENSDFGVGNSGLNGVQSNARNNLQDGVHIGTQNAKNTHNKLNTQNRIQNTHNTQHNEQNTHNTPQNNVKRIEKENIGVIWGKDGKHFSGHENMLKVVANDKKVSLKVRLCLVCV
jgi:hypothetical protein